MTEPRRAAAATPAPTREELVEDARRLLLELDAVIVQLANTTPPTHPAADDWRERQYYHLRNTP